LQLLLPGPLFMGQRRTKCWGCSPRAWWEPLNPSTLPPCQRR